MRGFLDLDTEEVGAPGLRLATFLAVALVLGLTAIVAMSLVRERDAELAEVSRLAERSASGVAETLGQGLDKADLILLTLSTGFGRSWPESGMPSELLGLDLADWLAFAPLMSAIRIHDASGTAANGARMDPILLSRHRDAAVAHELSAVPREAGGGLRLSRRIDATDGRLLGVALAEMPSRAFEGLVDAVAPPEVECAALTDAEGRIVARWQRPSRSQMCMDAVASAPDGGRSGRAGNWASVVLALGDRPFFVMIEADTGIALSRWQDRAFRQLMLLALLVIGITLASVVINRLLRRQLEISTLLQTFVDNSTTAINMRDADGRFILANQTFEALFGVNRAELIGKRSSDVFPAEIAEPSEAEFRHVMTTRRPLEFNRGFKTRQGLRHFVFTRFPVFGPGGRIVAVGAVGTDITDIRSATAALRRSEEKFAKVFHESPDAIAIIRSADAMIIEANEGYGRLIGRPLGAVLNRRVTEFDWWEDLADRSRFLDELERNGIIRDFAFRARQANGRGIACVITAVIIDIDGVRHDVSITRDMTQQIESAERLQQANERLAEQASTLERLAQDYRRQREEAETANRAKTEFLAHMSHELRTPLNAVIGFSEMIQSQLVGPVAPRYVDYAEAIGRAARHLVTVISDILDVSKIEVGRYELSKEPVDVASVVADCCRMIAGRADVTGLLVVNDVPDGLPRPWADARAIKQVLLNLLSNSVKFTPADGRITVGASEENGAIKVTVADTGVGIPKEDVAHVFEAFWQAESHTTRNRDGAGTGLGLAICKKLVELHGGRIEIESQVGRGTEVTIRLPLGGAPLEAVASTG